MNTEAIQIAAIASMSNATNAESDAVSDLGRGVPFRA